MINLQKNNVFEKNLNFLKYNRRWLSGKTSFRSATNYKHPKIKIRLEIRRNKYEIRSAHLLSDNQYQKQKKKGRSLAIGKTITSPTSLSNSQTAQGVLATSNTNFTTSQENVKSFETRNVLANYPLIDKIQEFGGIAKKPANYKGGEYDGLIPYNKTGGLGRFIYPQTGGLEPDIMAEHLYSDGIISKPDVDLMWASIADQVKAYKNRINETKPKKLLPEEEQTVDFIEDTETQSRRNKEKVQANELSIGDKVTVKYFENRKMKSEELEVTDIDPDTFEVTLKDGAKYGVQKIEDGQTFYAANVENNSSDNFDFDTTYQLSENPQINTPEFKQWFGDWENDPENASKVVDKNGKPLVVYHGSLNQDFTVFSLDKAQAAYGGKEKAIWFSPSPNFADSYTGINGRKYSVYLSMKNPLIIKRGMRFNLPDGMPGFLYDGSFDDNFFEFALNKAKNEGKDGVIFEKVQEQYHPHIDQYAVFSPTQIKSATGNCGTFDSSNPDITYQLSADALVAFHNLSKENLEHSQKMGGIAAPSVGITKVSTPVTGYGEISLIPKPDMIDPSKNKSAITKNADFYTPRYPSVDYVLNHKKANAVIEELKNYKDDLEQHSVLSTSDIENRGLKAFKDDRTVQYKFLKDNNIPFRLVYKQIKKEPLFAVYPKLKKILQRFPHTPVRIVLNKNPEIVEVLKQAVDKNKQALIKDGLDAETARKVTTGIYFNGDGTVKTISFNDLRIKANSPAKEINRAETFQKLQDKINKNEAKFTKWVEDNYSDIITDGKLFDGFTNSGSRKYKAHTLDNVISYIKKNMKEGENFNYGVGSIRSKVAKKYKNLKQIQADRNNIVTAEDMQKFKDEFSEIFQKLADDLSQYMKYGSTFYMDDIANIFQEMGETGNIPGKLKEYFKEEAVKYADDIAAFFETLKNAPTEYFESKILRPVDFSEFEYALVPRGKEYTEAVNILKESGVKVKRYQKDNNESLTDAYNSLKNVTFQFAGAKSQTADTSMLQKAKEMETRGETKESILKDTGWFRGMDKKWRYEISDKDMNITDDLKQFFKTYDEAESSEAAPIKLTDVIKHDKLFEAYPILKSVQLNLYKLNELSKLQGRNSIGGTFNRRIKTISVSFANYDDLKKTLAHEIQHAIQEIEEFAGGGTPKQFEPKRPSRDMAMFRWAGIMLDSVNAGENIEDVVEQAKQEVLDRNIDDNEYSSDDFAAVLHFVNSKNPIEEIRRWNELSKIPVKENDLILKERNKQIKKQQEIVDNIGKVTENLRSDPEIKDKAELSGMTVDEYEKHWLKKLYKESDKLKELQEYKFTDIDRYNAYFNLAGEIEARDTANRGDLFAEERREIFPDVRDNANVTFQLASLADLTEEYIRAYDQVRSIENTFEKFQADWWYDKANEVKQQILGRLEEFIGDEAPINQGKVAEDKFIRSAKARLRYIKKDEFATENDSIFNYHKLANITGIIILNLK